MAMGHTALTLNIKRALSNDELGVAKELLRDALGSLGGLGGLDKTMARAIRAELRTASDGMEHRVTGDKLIVTVKYDSDLQCPTDWDCQWALYPFNSRLMNSKNPSEFGLRMGRDGNIKAPIGLQRKLDVGTAFMLDYYEHGGSAWSLHGEGMQCRWDTSSYDGILIWENKPSDMGAKTREARAKDANSFLETYNCWANGQGYGYEIENEEGEDIDSCWGFYGNDLKHMVEDNIKPHLVGKEYEVRGEARDEVMRYLR
ncbi:MAG: hypothetical protein A2Y38_17040 [Spirochaetes bacterium GWB1_59_5]|nr:MAG: hypothetical protein A2Y38_17040 [Spirochaetes bacterium GWB1_59_5]